MEYCRYCGAKIMDDSKFCSKCGKNIEISAHAGDTDNGRTGTVYDELLQSLVNDSAAGKLLNGSNQNIVEDNAETLPGYEYHKPVINEPKAKKPSRIRSIAEIAVPGLVGFLVQVGLSVCLMRIFYFNIFGFLSAMFLGICVTVFLRTKLSTINLKLLPAKERYKKYCGDLIFNICFAEFVLICKCGSGCLPGIMYLLLMLLVYIILLILFSKFYSKKTSQPEVESKQEKHNEPIGATELIAKNMEFLANDSVSDAEKDMFIQSVISAVKLHNKNAK